MTERWRKKLGDLDGATPGDDVFARAHEGPQQPDPMVPMPGMGNRVATGIAAFMVFALAISVFAIPVLRMNDPAAPGAPTQILPLWPERSLDDLEVLQAKADAGDADATWATDPEQVATRFGEQVLGWESVSLSSGGNSICVDPARGDVWDMASCPTTIEGRALSGSGYCSPYGLPGGGTGYLCSTPAEPGTYATATYGPTGGPSTSAPDPFRVFTLHYDVACDACPSPTMVRLYQPLDSGEGKVWAVIEARSAGARISTSVGQALRLGDGVEVTLQENGETTPTLAVEAGSETCITMATQASEPTGRGALLSVEIRGCGEDSPGYVWAAMSWKPMMDGQGNVADPLEDGRGDPLFEFVALPVTLLANQPTGTVTELPPTDHTNTATAVPNAWTIYTDERFGFTILGPNDGMILDVASSALLQLSDGARVRITPVPEAPPADDSRFPIDTSAVSDITDVMFRGDGVAFRFTAEDLAPDGQSLPTIARMLASIRFEPWSVGETRGDWTAIGEILPNSSAEWLLFDGERYVATNVGNIRVLFGPVPRCPEGEGTSELSEGGAFSTTCSDGVSGSWDFAGRAAGNNVEPFNVDLEMTRAIRSWDGMLLISIP